MFKHLRTRIILIAAGALAIALFMYASVLSSVFYINTNKQIDSVLQILSDNHGQLDIDNQTSNQLGINSPEALYQYRYFSLVVDKNDHLVSASTDNIRSIRDEDVDKVLKEVLKQKYDHGRVVVNGLTFSYKETSQKNGDNLIVILDSGQFYQNSNNLRQLTYILSAASFVLFLVIFTIFSGKIIRPFIRNMEKQRRFVTNAGHELKTPLAIIQANTELQELMTGENEWSRPRIRIPV